VTERWGLVAIDAAPLGYETTLRRAGRVLEEVEPTSPTACILYLAYDRRELALVPQEERLKIYRFIGELLDERGIPWGVCKEIPQVVEALKSHAGFEPQRCNCIW